MIETGNYKENYQNHPDRFIRKFNYLIFITLLAWEWNGRFLLQS